MLENLKAFNRFFINFEKVNPELIKNLNKLRFLYTYKFYY